MFEFSLLRIFHLTPMAYSMRICFNGFPEFLRPSGLRILLFLGVFSSSVRFVMCFLILRFLCYIFLCCCNSLCVRNALESLYVPALLCFHVPN